MYYEFYYNNYEYYNKCIFYNSICINNELFLTVEYKQAIS